MLLPKEKIIVHSQVLSLAEQLLDRMTNQQQHLGTLKTEPIPVM